MDEIILKTTSWSFPEYNHIERSVDWFWGVGIVAFLFAVGAIFIGNYMFAVFILVGGASIILFNIRRPRDITITIETDGFTIGNEKHEWKKMKGFRIKKTDTGSKLLIRTGQKFLPTFTIPLSQDIEQDVKESLSKVLTVMDELDESPSVVFMEKLGF